MGVDVLPVVQRLQQQRYHSSAAVCASRHRPRPHLHTTPHRTKHNCHTPRTLATTLPTNLKKSRWLVPRASSFWITLLGLGCRGGVAEVGGWVGGGGDEAIKGVHSKQCYVLDDCESKQNKRRL